METVNIVPPTLKIFVEMRRGKGGCSLRESICRGGFFLVYFVVYLLERETKMQFILVMKKKVQ